MSKLLIIETQTKAKIIKHYLPKGWLITATSGHFKQIDTKKGLNAVKINKLSYHVHYSSLDTVKKRILDNASKSNEIYIATDLDREGELIGENVRDILIEAGFKEKNIFRTKYNEITKPAILAAINNKSEFNIYLAEASKTRSILDFLYGYSFSPILWKSVPFAVSAGRVQSCALALICKREFEIINGNVETFFIIKCLYRDFEGTLNIKNRFETSEEAQKIIQSIDFSSCTFNHRTKLSSEGKDTRLKTTTLQRQAGLIYGWGSQKTMVVAQKLYEGIDGFKQGLITYLRTDAIDYSKTFVDHAKEYIEKTYGKNILISEDRKNKTVKVNTQEAHEGIRPTDLNIHPDQLKDIDDSYYKLYKLIWESSILYFIKDTKYTTEYIDIVLSDLTITFANKFVTYTGQLLFDKDINTSKNVFKDFDVTLIENNTAESKTKLKSRYSEGALIKELESEGIGRPGTYATIIDTLSKRGYISKIGNALFPTKNGLIKNEFISSNFPEYNSVNFSAWMEENLTNIAMGTKNAAEFLYTFDSKIKTFRSGYTENQKEVWIKTLQKSILEKVIHKSDESLLFLNNYHFAFKDNNLLGFISQYESQNDNNETILLKCLAPVYHNKKWIAVSNSVLCNEGFGGKNYPIKSEIINEVLSSKQLELN